MTTATLIACDRLRGHWHDGAHRYGCACPTPPEAPASRLTDEQLDRFIILGATLAVRPLMPCEVDEYAPLWELAFPHLAPWRR